MRSTTIDRPCFNPLPSQKQGETCCIYNTHNTRKSFNPLPSQKQGETPPAAGHGDPTPRFNPLPSQKQGETALLKRLQRRDDVSIRSPHRSKGRPSCCWTWRSHAAFQSAPLTEARGDHAWILSHRRALRFQSAPLTEARGDADRATAKKIDGSFQSAPLTEARGDRLLIRAYLILPGVSIRSPHRSKGRRWLL